MRPRPRKVDAYWQLIPGDSDLSAFFSICMGVYFAQHTAEGSMVTVAMAIEVVVSLPFSITP